MSNWRIENNNYKNTVKNNLIKYKYRYQLNLLPLLCVWMMVFMYLQVTLFLFEFVKNEKNLNNWVEKKNSIDNNGKLCWFLSKNNRPTELKHILQIFIKLSVDHCMIHSSVAVFFCYHLKWLIIDLLIFWL